MLGRFRHRADSVRADAAAGRFGHACARAPTAPTTRSSWKRPTRWSERPATTVVRIGWEFNGNWMPWAASKDPESYKRYFRRIVEIMRRAPGQRFQFEWCPNHGRKDMDPTEAYPGDDVVDIIGMDVYAETWDASTSDPDKALPIFSRPALRPEVASRLRQGARQADLLSRMGRRHAARRPWRRRRSGLHRAAWPTGSRKQSRSTRAIGTCRRPTTTPGCPTNSFPQAAATFKRRFGASGGG